MADADFRPDEVIRGASGLAVSAAAVLLGPAFLLGVLLWQSPQKARQFGLNRLAVLGVILAFLVFCVWILWLDPFPLYELDTLQGTAIWHIPRMVLARAVVLFWFGGSGLVLLLAPVLVLFQRIDSTIRASDFDVRVRRFNDVLKVFEDRTRAPLGIDVRNGQVVALEERRRCNHSLILGATGSGKTTLLTNLVLHAIRHRQPCIIIDPKIEKDTVSMIRELGQHLDPGFDQRFRHFNISRPEESATYNPLKHGNASQLKDRILEALNWSEQYYQAVSADSLTDFAASVAHLKLPFDLDYLSRALGRKEVQAELLKKLKEHAQTGDDVSEALFERLSFMLSNLEKKDVKGLQAQLSVLNNPTIGHLLSFKEPKNEIDLRQVMARNEIAYFQLDTLGNADTSRRLGRMIFEDLKGLASYIYNTVAEEDRKFLPVFFDEFGGLTSKEFIEGVKQVRGAKIGLHLFSQGLEDLDAISEPFRRQVGANPMTKIMLRLDDSKTVNEVCSMVGTVDSIEQSYQVEGTLVQTKTGMGNQRESKKMRIEHDVLKNLETGQAVVIEKSPSRVVPIQIFHPALLKR